MKSFYISFIAILLLIGCGDRGLDSSNNSNNNDIELQGNSDYFIADNSLSLQEKIDLIFEPLQMFEIPKVEGSIKWKYIKSIPFGQLGMNKAVLDLYEFSSLDDNQPSQIEGVLNVENVQYHITNISNSLIETDQVNCPQVCLFQRLFSGQNQFELIGSVELFSNGPGLNLYVVYDAMNNKLMSFDNWGKPSFIDLDNDGNDEFVIEFQGLHLNWPDISIITIMNSELKISTSVFSALERKQGDFAKLITSENAPPIISLSNVWHEDATTFNYTYSQGILEKVDFE